MKKTIKIASTICALILMLLVFANCQKQTSPPISTKPTKDPTAATQTIQAILNDLYTETPIPSNTSPPTLTPTITPTFTLTPTIWPTGTPYATLEPLPTIENKEAYYQELMQKNAGCQYPCFWGIIPGETSWQIADQFLSSIATEISEIIDNLDGRTFRSYRFQIIEDDNETYIIYILMKNKDGVVDRMQISKTLKGVAPWKRAQFISVEKVLQELGQPSNVFIYVNIGQMELWSSYLTLTYDNENIFFTYLTSHADTYEDGIICYGSDPRIEIGYPQEKITPYDIHEHATRKDFIEEYKTIDEITDMTTETFTGVTDPETGDFCFELDVLEVLGK